MHFVLFEQELVIAVLLVNGMGGAGGLLCIVALLTLLLVDMLL